MKQWPPTQSIYARRSALLVMKTNAVFVATARILSRSTSTHSPVYPIRCVNSDIFITTAYKMAFIFNITEMTGSTVSNRMAMYSCLYRRASVRIDRKSSKLLLRSLTWHGVLPSTVSMIIGTVAPSIELISSRDFQCCHYVDSHLTVINSRNHLSR